MATMNISLPGAMKDWVETQTAGGRYANVSDYVRDLIRRDQERTAALASLAAEIEAGWASGLGQRDLSDLLAEARRRAGVA